MPGELAGDDVAQARPPRGDVRLERNGGSAVQGGPLAGQQRGIHDLGEGRVAEGQGVIGAQRQDVLLDRRSDRCLDRADTRACRRGQEGRGHRSPEHGRGAQDRMGSLRQCPHPGVERLVQRRGEAVVAGVPTQHEVLGEERVAGRVARR